MRKIFPFSSDVSQKGELLKALRKERRFRGFQIVDEEELWTKGSNVWVVTDVDQANIHLNYQISRVMNRHELRDLIKYLKDITHIKFFKKCVEHSILVFGISQFIRKALDGSHTYSSLKFLGNRFVKVEDKSGIFKPITGQSLPIPVLYLGSDGPSIFQPSTGISSRDGDYPKKYEDSVELGYCDVCQYKDIIQDMNQHCNSKEHRERMQSAIAEMPLLSQCDNVLTLCHNQQSSPTPPPSPILI